MLGKLLKYDFRSMSKEFALFWPACLAMGLILRFTLGNGAFTVETQGDMQLLQFSGILNGILGLVFFALLVAMCVVALLFVIQRFYHGLLGSEGYLMHTLPVKPWQLVASKLITAVVVAVVSTIVGILSVAILVPVSLWELISSPFAVIGTIFRQMGGDGVLLVVEIALLCLMGLTCGILQLYLAMALGHLFGRNRLLGSFLSFLGISVVLNILSSFLFVFLEFIDLPQGALDLLSGVTNITLMHLFLWALILGTGALAAIFFFATTYILKHRLSLE